VRIPGERRSWSETPDLRGSPGFRRARTQGRLRCRETAHGDVEDCLRFHGPGRQILAALECGFRRPQWQVTLGMRASGVQCRAFGRQAGLCRRIPMTAAWQVDSRSSCSRSCNFDFVHPASSPEDHRVQIVAVDPLRDAPFPFLRGFNPDVAQERRGEIQTTAGRRSRSSRNRSRSPAISGSGQQACAGRSPSGRAEIATH